MIDIRWIQRFDDFCRSLDQLAKFMQKEELNEGSSLKVEND